MTRSWIAVVLTGGAIALILGCGTQETKEVAGERAGTTALPPSAGRDLILETDQAYPGQMNLGPVFRELYDRYHARYGWEASTLVDFCGELVAGSLTRGTTKEGLASEFNSIRALDPSSYLLITAGAITDKAGLTENDFRPMVLDRVHRAIKDPAEIVRFDTATLGDGVRFVWSFTVGYEYYRRYNEQLDPTPGEPQTRDALSQAEIDSLVGSIGRTYGVKER